MPTLEARMAIQGRIRSDRRYRLASERVGWSCMTSCGECLVDVVGDALSGAGDVDAGVPPHRRFGQIEGGDQDAVDVVGPLGAADLASVDAVGDRRSEVGEREAVDDRVFLLAVEVGADHPVEVVGVGGREAVGVALAGGVAALVAAAGSVSQYFAQAAATFEAGRESWLAQQGGEVDQEIVAGLGGHSAVCSQPAGQGHEQNSVGFDAGSSAVGHGEHGEHDLVRTVLVAEVAQCADEPIDVADPVERRMIGWPVAWQWLIGEGLLECSELCTEMHGCLLGVGLSEAMVRFRVPGDVPDNVPDRVPEQDLLFPIGAQ